MPPTSGGILCQCGRLMKCRKVGVHVEELTETQEPYKIWVADRYSCPECDTEVCSGFGADPVAEHYQDDYDEKRRTLQPIPARCRPVGVAT